MGKRRTALRDVITSTQYRQMLKTAAQIDDRHESIAIFFYLVMMGRLGLRVGEVIHMQRSWYDPERSVISIPPHEPCDCGLCRHYARQYAKSHGLEFEDVLENYWQVKDGSDRDVTVPTARDRAIIELYFDAVPYTEVSYSTINRRLKKVAELSGAAPEHTYPHMLRATAATHLIWSGMRPPALDYQFGWEDEKTKERYAQKTGWRVKEEFDRMWDRDGSSTFKVHPDPPTYDNLRPDKRADRILVKSWSVDTPISRHPRTRDEEPLIHDIEEYDDAPAAVDPISPAVRHRLNKELEAATESDEVIYPLPPRRAAALCLCLLAFATVMGTALAASNTFWIDVGGGEVHATPGATIGLVLGFGAILSRLPDL